MRPERLPRCLRSYQTVYDWIQGRICDMSGNPPAECSVQGNGEETNALNNMVFDNVQHPNQDLIQPKGVSLRINYDEYPQENAWMLYKDDTQEEVHCSNYG